MRGITYSAWSKQLAALFFYLGVVIAAFYGTAKSMVMTWIELETYNHGFLIIPITLWLIWRQKSRLELLHPKADFLALLPLVASGFLWLLGTLVDVLVVQQFALVALLISGVWALLGREFAWQNAFPLAFLFFAVPMGDGLVPALMEYTASFTVWMVELTGIPVYREGMYFSLPSGNWSVIAACSGVRYLIASLTLGCVYAYISYDSLSKRLLFVALSIIVPIIANGFRAYMIVMIGHLSGMELAVGVDHLLYGWVFFGLVMFALFYLGSYWRDEPAQEKESLADKHPEEYSQALSPDSARRHVWVAFTAVVVVTLVWPWLSYALAHRNIPDHRPLQLVVPVETIHAVDPVPWSWVPKSVGANQVFTAHYQYEGHQLGVYLHQYLQQEQGAELVTSENIYSGSRSWRQIRKGSYPLDIKTGVVHVNQMAVKSPRQSLLVWMFYRIGDDYYTGNDYVAKSLEAWQKLRLGRLDSARIVLAVELDNDGKAGIAEGQKVLSDFLSRTLPIMASSLDSGAGW
jgi:exosortase A